MWPAVDELPHGGANIVIGGKALCHIGGPVGRCITIYLHPPFRSAQDGPRVPKAVQVRRHSGRWFLVVLFHSIFLNELVILM
jgi:hypothetical protein